MTQLFTFTSFDFNKIHRNQVGFNNLIAFLSRFESRFRVFHYVPSPPLNSQSQDSWFLRAFCILLSTYISAHWWQLSYFVCFLICSALKLKSCPPECISCSLLLVSCLFPLIPGWQHLLWGDLLCGSVSCCLLFLCCTKASHSTFLPSQSCC